MATQESTTRRAVMGAALVISALALPAVGLVAPDPDETFWRDLEIQARRLAPDGHLAVRRARLRNMRPDDYSGVYVAGRGCEPKRLTLMFGDWRRDWNAEHYYVDAEKVRRAVAV